MSKPRRSASWFESWKRSKVDAGEWTDKKVGSSSKKNANAGKRVSKPAKKRPAVVECPHCGGTHAVEDH